MAGKVKERRGLGRGLEDLSAQPKLRPQTIRAVAEKIPLTRKMQFRI